MSDNDRKEHHCEKWDKLTKEFEDPKVIYSDGHLELGEFSYNEKVDPKLYFIYCPYCREKLNDSIPTDEERKQLAEELFQIFGIFGGLTESKSNNTP